MITEQKRLELRTKRIRKKSKKKKQKEVFCIATFVDEVTANFFK